jgi:hypothetical protein
LSKLSPEEVNEILKKYDNYIERVTRSMIASNTAPFSIQTKDIIQEVRIQMFYLLRDVYDSDIKPVDIFVKAFLPNTIRGVATRLDYSLKVTGNTNTRSQQRELQKRMVYIESVPEYNRFVNPDFKYEQNRSNITDFFIDFFTQHLSEEDVMDFSLDKDKIIAKIKGNLKPNNFKLFTYVFLMGLRYKDAAKLVECHPSTVSKTIRNKIIPVIKKVFQEFGYV